MIILGVVAHTLGYGDAAATLCVGDRIVGIIEEERFSRVRYDAGFPREAIRSLLDMAGISGRDIDQVALHLRPSRGIGNRLYWMAQHPIDTVLNCGDYLNGLKSVGGLRRELEEALGSNGIAITSYPHHMCHAAAAFYSSPYDRAACLILDGAGEGLTGLIAQADRAKGVVPLRAFSYPHSLGLFYSAICDHIGFPPPAGPGKVMGLAAYGDAGRFKDFMRRIAWIDRGSIRLDLKHFLFHRNLVTPLTPKSWVSPQFVRESGVSRRHGNDELEQDHIDLAAALQTRTNELGLELAHLTAELTGENDLCLGGGVALNSVMNGVVADQGRFRRVHVQPASGDAGNALGAVFLAASANGRTVPTLAEAPYCGPAYSNRSIEAALRRRNLRFRKSPDVAREAAEAIHSDRIVSWFQGRMEYGPRALGNRSILANPQNADMRDIINKRVKHREWFRPFAPSVTHEAYSRYFTGSPDNPYMLIVASVRDSWRGVFPSITHVDGSARPQSVSRQANPLYHSLLEHLGRLQEHPVVLNTSFNDNEPIVCTPDDAIDCFVSTDIDVLCMGDCLVDKHAQD